MASVGIVSVHFDPKRTRHALLVVAALVRRLPQPVRVCLVANSDEALSSLAGASAAVGVDVSTVLHDNTGWEFGAYQAGLGQLGEMPDWLVVVNDALAARQAVSASSLDHLRRTVERSPAHPVIAGQIEGSSRSFVLAGERTHRWVTTNLFALNRSAVEVLGGRLRDPTLDALVRETAVQSEFFADAVDPVLREHVEHWLFSERGPQDVWHSAAPLGPDNAGFMAGKARSILQEKRLAACLEGASAEFVSTRDTRFVARVQTKGQKLLNQLREL